MCNSKKIFCFAVAVCVLLSFQTAVFAASWPTKPVNLVVAFAAGGNSDFNARSIAKYLSKELKQPVVVSNIAGSGGSIAAAQVKDAKADGYTVLVSQLSINIAEAVGMVNFGFRDLASVCVFSQGADEVLVVRADAPWNTLKEMVEDTKKNPGKYKLTANTGASTQWIAVALQKAGAKFNVVSSGGSGERITLLLGSHVDIIPMPWNMVEDYVKTNKFKVLANVSPKRSSLIPNVPTLKELGYDCAFYYYNTFFMPKGTDPAVINALSRAVEKVVTTNADYKKEIAGFAQEPTYLNTKDTVAYYQKELDELFKISDQLQGKNNVQFSQGMRPANAADAPLFCPSTGRMIYMYKSIMKNTGTGIFFIVFALVYLFGTSRISGFSPFGNRGLDSKSIPQMLGVLMCALAALHIVITVQQNKRETQLNGASKEAEPCDICEETPSKKQGALAANASVCGSIGLLVAYVLIYNQLGFILSTVLYLILAMILLTPLENRRKRALFIISFSVAFTVPIYIVFTKYLTLFLPLGILG